MHGNPLWQAFVTPFTDIIDTGMYAVKRIGTVTAQEVASLAMQAAAAITPFIGIDTMNAIESNAKANIQKQLANLDTQYKDVINRNLDAIFNQSDAWGLAFLFNPGLILGSKLAVTAPAIVAGMLGTILGGRVLQPGQSGSIADSLATMAHNLQLLENDPAHFFFSQRQVGAGQQHSNFDMSLVNAGGGGYDVYGDYEGIYEQQQQQQKPSITPQMIKQAKANIVNAIKKIFKNPLLKTSIAKSQFSKQMQTAGVNAIQQGMSQTFATIKDYKTLQIKYGNNPAFKKIDDEITNGFKKQNMNDQQIAAEKEKMFPQIKKQFKQMLVKQLQNTHMDKKTETNILKTIMSIN